jgi:hypothetical protein
MQTMLGHLARIKTEIDKVTNAFKAQLAAEIKEVDPDH